MIIENSIESRIIQLQEKKAALFQATVGKDLDAIARLTEEDLQVGNSNTVPLRHVDLVMFICTNKLLHVLL
jgi:hypothetical protein